jgi:hypothetical protein
MDNHITDAPDQLVPDAKVRQEFSTTLMTLYRWDKNPDMKALGWPPKIPLNGRNYRSRRQLDAFKASLTQVGLNHVRKPRSTGARRPVSAEA